MNINDTQCNIVTLSSDILLNKIEFDTQYNVMSSDTNIHRENAK